MTSELSHLIPAPTLHKITLPPDFWDLASGKRPDEKIVVELTPRAANWIKRFDIAEIKRHFNLKNTGHKNAAVEELAAACKKIADALDGKRAALERAAKSTVRAALGGAVKAITA